MRINTSSLFCLFLMLCWTITGRFAMGNDVPNERSPKNVLLKEGEIENLKVKKERKDSWETGVNGGMPIEKPGLAQELELNGILVIMKYCEFDNIDEAHKALDFYAGHQAARFEKGLWENAGQTLKADECLFGEDGGSTNLLFRSGKICILIGCLQQEDEPIRRKVALQIAQKILDKAAVGGHVIIPEEQKK